MTSPVSIMQNNSNRSHDEKDSGSLSPRRSLDYADASATEIKTTEHFHDSSATERTTDLASTGMVTRDDIHDDTETGEDAAPDVLMTPASAPFDISNFIVPHLDPNNTSYLDDWTATGRWTQVSQDRLQLVRDRLQLEQGLFEYAVLRKHRGHAPTEWQVFEGEGDDDDASEEYPTLSSIRWEQVDFPDGQVYEGQVLVLMKRAAVVVATEAPAESKAATTPKNKGKPRRRIALPKFRNNNKKKEDTDAEGTTTTTTTKLTTTTEWIRHGIGCNRWPDGQTYRGQWNWNSRDGRGTHSWPDGRSVTGGWTKGHLDGRIHFSWSGNKSSSKKASRLDDSTYDGGARNGQKDGRGVHTWASGCRVYCGEYHNGTEQGEGILTEAITYKTPTLRTPLLTKYRGKFVKGQRHGFGVQQWNYESERQLDKIYHGQWKNNVVNGRGTLVWTTTGANYEGDFKNGRFHGHGTYKYIVALPETFHENLPCRIVGDWYDGRPHGKGQEYAAFLNRMIYEGHYRKGRRHGFGKRIYSTVQYGDIVYVGGWNRGVKQGHGMLIRQENAQVLYIGYWQKNQPVLKQNSDNKKDKSSLSPKERVLQDLADTKFMSALMHTEPQDDAFGLWHRRVRLPSGRCKEAGDKSQEWKEEKIRALLVKSSVPSINFSLESSLPLDYLNEFDLPEDMLALVQEKFLPPRTTEQQ